MITNGYMKVSRACGHCDSIQLENTNRLLLLAPPIEVWECLNCGAEVRFPRTGPRKRRVPASDVIATREMEVVEEQPALPYKVEYRQCES